MVTKKQKFINYTLNKISNNQYNLKDIDYLITHKNKYSFELSINDISLILEHLYKETFAAAMQDGQIDGQELHYLLEIKSYMAQKHNYTNINQILKLKNKIKKVASHIRKETIYQNKYDTTNYTANHNTAINLSEDNIKEENNRDYKLKNSYFYNPFHRPLRPKFY